jgi:hypothetical protein
MKPLTHLLALGSLTLLASRAPGQTLDWGSPVGTDIVDSQGNPISNLFVIQIGAFVDGFTPDENNVSDWLANWRVFDAASYNPTLMYFTSVGSMNDDGTGTSPHATSGFSFGGLDAFLWIRRGDTPVAGTEWLLTRAVSGDPESTWEFPNPTPGCCDNEPNLQWSVSDLDGDDIPVWGSQGGVHGSGHYTVTGGYTLQTYTFIPEPSSLVLATLSAALLLRRRRH